jgi:hypothetical protein
LLARLNGEVRLDWAGRRAVSIPVARQLVGDYEAELAEAEQRESERLAAERAWEQERDAVFEKAYAEALEAAGREVLEAMARENVQFLGFGLPTGPAERARAAAAAREAVQAWEATHPSPRGDQR